MPTNKPPHAWYALRRTLPPWRFDELLEELKTQLPRYRVDELIVKIDTEEFFHGQPPIQWAKNYQKRLFRVREAMESLGVVYSLNPWITVGHCDRGRDSLSEVRGMQGMVGHDGTTCRVCACPIDPAWRSHTRQVWQIYAQTKPAVIWVEDDIRTFNHLPVRFGCFCPLHMKRFSQIIGQKVTREQLVNALLSPGRPHPWRKAWLDLQGELMIDTVAFLAGAVHEISPQTRMGLMSSGPRLHCMEGRQWRRFADALADGMPLLSRPPMGNYAESELRGFYYSHDSIKLTRHCMPPGTTEQTEVENAPFTAYSKSTAFTFLEMAISFAYSAHGVTLNLFDHCGTPMQADPSMGQMLGDRKAFLTGLAKVSQLEGKFRGVRLLHHDDASRAKQLESPPQYASLYEEGQEMMQALEAMGIPTTYDESNVTAACGQVLRAFGDREIRELLCGSLLLDAPAACVLAERGFARHIGLKRIAPPAPMDSLGAWAAEEITDAHFGGGPKTLVTTRLPHLGGDPPFSMLSPVSGARIVSRLVDPDMKAGPPAMIAFENSLGGRVVVHAWDITSVFGKAFLNPARQRQYQGAVRWLSRGSAAVLATGGGVYPLALRRDCGDKTLLGLFNLSLDPWPFAEFELTDARDVAQMQLLNTSGQWRASSSLKARKKGRHITIRCDASIPYDRPMFVCIRWK